MDHYSKLSAEAARREQKALWKTQRRRLASARLRFLSEDQERVQVPPRPRGPACPVGSGDSGPPKLHGTYMPSSGL